MNSKIKLKERKRYKIKLSIKNRQTNQLIAYVFKSNKHIYISLIKEGNVISHSNTLKFVKEDVANNKARKYRREYIEQVANEFAAKTKEKISDINNKMILYDTSYYKHQGNIKNLIDIIRGKFN